MCEAHGEQRSQRLIIKQQPDESDRRSYYSEPAAPLSQRGRVRNKINPKANRQNRNDGKERSLQMLDKLSAGADRKIQRAQSRAEARRAQRKPGVRTWSRS